MPESKLTLDSIFKVGDGTFLMEDVLGVAGEHHNPFMIREVWADAHFAS